MKGRTSGHGKWLFAAGLPLAGLIHLADRLDMRRLVTAGGETVSSGALYLSTLLFCLNLAIYAFLILVWARSVRERLLPSRERRYILASAMLMLFLLGERSVKYRLSGNSAPLEEMLWYAYYIPVFMLPTLFLMTALCMEARGRERRFDERVLLLPSGVLAVLVLTNGLHHLVFRPIEGVPLTGTSGGYFYGPLYYAAYAVLIAAAVAGLFFLTKAANRRRMGKRAAVPYLLILLTAALSLLQQRISRISGGVFQLYTFPELYCFGALGVLESCIRSRLIPFNENYAGFFAGMRQPAVITDEGLCPVYRTAAPVDCSAEQLRGALTAPVGVGGDLRLYGRHIPAGCVFWLEDGSELRRMNDRLIDANELLDSENALLRAETELAVEKARVESRNMVYSRVTEMMYPKQKQIAALLDGADPASPDFRGTLARVCVLNAYIKRATSLLLAEEGSGRIDRRELVLALEESGRFLAYLGVRVSVADSGPGRVERGVALSLYAVFEELCEALAPHITKLIAALDGTEIRLVADGGPAGPLPETELPVTAWEADGLHYFSFRAKGGEPS